MWLTTSCFPFRLNTTPTARFASQVLETHLHSVLIEMNSLTWVWMSIISWTGEGSDVTSRSPSGVWDANSWTAQTSKIFFIEWNFHLNLYKTIDRRLFITYTHIKRMNTKFLVLLIWRKKKDKIQYNWITWVGSVCVHGKEVWSRSVPSYNSCNKKSEAEESINACVISDVTDGRLTSALWRQQASRDQTVDKVAVFIRDTTLRPNQGVITCKNVYKTIWMDAAGDTGGKQLTCLLNWLLAFIQKDKVF